LFIIFIFINTLVGWPIPPILRSMPTYLRGFVKEIIEISDKVTQLEFTNIANNRIRHARSTLYKSMIETKVEKRPDREGEAPVEDGAEMPKVATLNEGSRRDNVVVIVEFLGLDSALSIECSPARIKLMLQGNRLSISGSCTQSGL